MLQKHNLNGLQILKGSKSLANKSSRLTAVFVARLLLQKTFPPTADPSENLV